MKAFNLLIRFLLELCALAALGYWGWHAASDEAGRIALVIAAPLTLSALWSLFAAHKAKYPPPRFWKAFVGVLLLESAALALALAEQGVLAGVFGAVILVNSGVVYRLNYQ